VTKKLYLEFARLKRTQENYYKIRANFNALPRGFKKTVYFYFLNRNCFNGIYRVNKQGEFNVPFSDSRVSPYLTLEEFRHSCDIISRSRIYNIDFEQFCLRKIKSNDFVYLDPPYYREGHRVFNEYDLVSFGPEDFERLDRVLQHLDKIGAKFLLSFPRTGDAIRLSQAWDSTTFTVRRTVAGDPQARGRQMEMLIFNYHVKPT
jgi:DNA adenine methylase